MEESERVAFGYKASAAFRTHSGPKERATISISHSGSKNGMVRYSIV